MAEMNLASVWQKIAAIEALIDKCRADNYGSVSAADRAEIKPVMDFLVLHYGENPAARELCNRLISRMNIADLPLNREIEKSFDLKTSLLDKINKNSDFSDEDKKNFETLLRDEEVSYSPNKKQLYVSYNYLENEDETAKMRKKTEQILDHLLSADGYGNRQLAAMLQDTPVQLRFTDGKSFDGEMSVRHEEGKPVPVLTLNQGAFQAGDDALAM